MSVQQEVLETGIKVVDLLAPYARGGKIGMSVSYSAPNKKGVVTDNFLYISLKTCRDDSNEGLQQVFI